MWLQHVRKWTHCRTQEYQVSLHKRCVEPYVGRNSHSCTLSPHDLPTPPPTPADGSESGDTPSLMHSTATTPHVGSPVPSSVSSPTPPKLPMASYDTYQPLFAPDPAWPTGTHYSLDLPDVAAAQQLTLLSQPHARCVGPSPAYPVYRRVLPSGHYTNSSTVDPPDLLLRTLAFVASEVSREEALIPTVEVQQNVSNGGEGVSLEDCKHWRPCPFS